MSLKLPLRKGCMSGWSWSLVFLVCLPRLRVMSQILRPQVGLFMLFLSTLMTIFSRTTEEHLSHWPQVLETLQRHILQIEEMCIFILIFNFQGSIVSTVVSTYGVTASADNVKAIREWLLNMVHEEKSFHLLPTFYMRFGRGFCTIMALFIDCLMQRESKWTKYVKALEEIIEKLTTCSVFDLLDFSQAFEIVYGASGVGTYRSIILSQESHPKVFFSKNMK